MTTKFTADELNATMRTSQSLLGIATSQEPVVGVTALIMAGAVAASTAGVPLETYLAQVDKASEEVYRNAGALKANLD